MVRFKLPARGAGGALWFSEEARSVLFADSRHGRVAPRVCRGLIQQFDRHGFSFFVGCARGVDASFRTALAAGGHRDRMFVGCAFGHRVRACASGGLDASVVVPENIPRSRSLGVIWLIELRGLGRSS